MILRVIDYAADLRLRCVLRMGWQNTTSHFLSRNMVQGRSGTGSTPQNTVVTVASVALYSITSNADASTTI